MGVRPSTGQRIQLKRAKTKVIYQTGTGANIPYFGTYCKVNVSRQVRSQGVTGTFLMEVLHGVSYMIFQVVYSFREEFKVGIAI